MKLALAFVYAATVVSLMSVSIPVWSQQQSLTEVQALDEDRNGVQADVLRIFGDGREEWLAKTDGKGLVAFTPAVSCEFNHRIRVRPDSPIRYQQPEYQRCGKSLSFLVKRWGKWLHAIADFPDRKIVESLMKQAETLRGENKFGGLALVYTELSLRLERADPSVVNQLREHAYLNAAKALRVDHVLTYEETKGASVMSPHMIVALNEFQKKKGVNVTGKLDGATLQAMAGNPYSQYLYEHARPLPIGGPDVELNPSELEEASRILGNLESNTKAALERGDRALALLLSGELTQRYWQLGRIPDGRAAEKQTYELAAEVLRVEGGAIFDPVQSKHVMSGDLVSAVMNYQEGQGLRVSGRLDFGTLQRLSGRTLPTYMYNVVE